MFATQWSFLKKILVCLPVLLWVMTQPVMAGSVVDIDRQHSLGTVLTNQSEDQVYFSLGNGRAIELFLARKRNKNATVVEKLLFRENDRAMKVRPVKKRNFRW
jgi:hypothetical protein